MFHARPLQLIYTLFFRFQRRYFLIICVYLLSSLYTISIVAQDGEVVEPSMPTPVLILPETSPETSTPTALPEPGGEASVELPISSESETSPENPIPTESPEPS